MGIALIPDSLTVHLAAKFDWDDASLEPFKKIYSLIPFVSEHGRLVVHGSALHSYSLHPGCSAFLFTFIKGGY